MSGLPKLTPAMVFDLDGTVRRAPDGGFTGLGRQELFPGVEAALWSVRDEGYLIFGATNQGGVAYGLKSHQEVDREIDEFVELFQRNPFHQIQSALHHPKGTIEPWCHRSLLRKPGYGMLVQLESGGYEGGYIVDWDNSVMVGDSEDDKGCAVAAGIRFVWAWDYFGREKPAP